jgi:hypothetical protein
MVTQGCLLRLLAKSLLGRGMSDPYGSLFSFLVPCPLVPPNSSCRSASRSLKHRHGRHILFTAAQLRQELFFHWLVAHHRVVARTRQRVSPIPAISRQRDVASTRGGDVARWDGRVNARTPERVNAISRGRVIASAFSILRQALGRCTVREAYTRERVLALSRHREEASTRQRVVSLAED